MFIWQVSVYGDIFPDFHSDELRKLNKKFQRYIQNNLKFSAHHEYGNVFAQKMTKGGVGM